MGAQTAGVAPGQRPTLSPGSQGPYVKLLQKKLRGAGRRLEIDGRFGPTTTRAVKATQKLMKLEPDGIVGEKTWEALDAVSRGEAISDADDKRLLATYNEGRSLRDAGQYQAALAKFMAIYSDPLLASKPMMLRHMIWNIANSHHNLAFAPGIAGADAKAKLNEAVSWYQEFTAREGIAPEYRANAVNAIRRCRLGQPPQSLAEMGAEKYKMGVG